MIQQNDKRKTYDTWDEAFRGLAPAARQQSVRIASYTQALYVEACTAGFGAEQRDAADRIRSDYAELAYKCGLYHQLGKALVPEEYQVFDDKFSEEERALYRRYPVAGRLLVAQLQEKSGGNKRWNGKGEPPTENIPWLMIRESCQQHMERYDGTGYPDGRAGEAISPIAQIVGMAKEFDHLSAEVKSENPFSEAYDAILQESGRAFSPELCAIFKSARSKMQSIFNKYIHYTMKLPHTVPLVKKTKGRPMGLRYRGMTGGDPVGITAYEAIPWFSVKKDETVDMAAVAPRLARTGMTADVTFYLLYEAADMLLRMQNCKLDVQHLLMPMFAEFYSKENYIKRFEELFENQPIDRSHLLLTIPEERVLDANKGVAENISRYLKNGITLVLDGYHPESISPAKLKEWGFSYVRLSPETSAQPLYASDIRALLDRGITVLAACAEHQHLKWLTESGVSAVSSPLNGEPDEEDAIIRDALLREREATS